MDAKLIFSITAGLIGGVGMFLYGMTLMSEGLQKAAGESLKRILEKLTSNRIIGTGVGMLVTVLVQSSSATTVMVVGFVNAGLMNLTQALSVVLGANIGTTITAQIIAFKVSALALPAIGVGAFMHLLIKKDNIKNISQIILGFGLLFVGMSTMTEAFAPLQKSPEFTEFFVKFSYNPILGVIVGAVTTMILQSSSAVVGITMALAMNGLVDFPASVALILGDNIGTTITANLAAVGGSRTAKQAAFGHFLFNFLGVCYMLIFMKPFMAFINFITPGDPSVIVNGVNPAISRHIANSHTMFNILNTIIFLPLLPFLAFLCEKIIKSDQAQRYKYTKLSDVMVKTPEIAVAQARQEVNRMSAITVKMLKDTQNAISKWDHKKMGKIEDYEFTLAGFQSEVSHFLGLVNTKQLSQKTLQMVEALKQATRDMDAIGDQSQKIMRTTQKMLNKKQPLTSSGKKELDEMFDAVIDFASITFTIFASGLPQSEKDLELEDKIDKMHKQFRKNHMKRLNKGSCELDTGLTFVDIIGLLEGIGDNIFNVAQINFRRNKKIAPDIEAINKGI